MKIVTYPSANFEDRKDDIRFLIIHATGTPNLKSTLQHFVRSQAPYRISCHYLIDTDGTILQLVPDDKTAWHAGVSDWKDYAKNKGEKSLNHSSIGIELQLTGLTYDAISDEVLTFQAPTQQQLASCSELCKNLMKTYHIAKGNVLRHSDIAPTRKFDPGQNFPWADFIAGFDNTFL